MKNIIITTIALLLFGSLIKAQEPPIITQVKTKSRIYRLYKSVDEFAYISISDANYKAPHLTDIQLAYSHGEEVITLDRNMILAILRQELGPKNVDFVQMHKGKAITISFVLNSIDRSIRTVSFDFSTDFIKDYKVIERIDNRFRKELVFAPKRDEKYMDQSKSLTPIYYMGCAIPVDKL